MRKNILAPSILASNFCELGKEIQITESNGAEYLHFDVMDGVFVPSISFGTLILCSVRKATKQFIDVHLMVKEPIECIEGFVKAGADNITIHLEACEDVQKTLDTIKKHNIKCGISIKPDTKVEALIPYLSQVDMVLIMSVEPGKGGQAFMETSLDKISELKTLIEQLELSVDIEVDGGIYAGNLLEVLNAGANVIVAGSAVFNGDIEKNTKSLVDIMEEHEKACSNR